MAQECPEYKQLIEIFLSKKPLSSLPQTHPAKQFQGYWNDISLHENLLLYQDRIIVPRSARKEILNLMHSSHDGIVTMRQLAKAFYFWPGQSNQIKQTVENCEACRKLLPSQTNTKLQSNYGEQYPMSHLCLDLFHHSKYNYLAAIDSHLFSS